MGASSSDETNAGMARFSEAAVDNFPSPQDLPTSSHIDGKSGGESTAAGTLASTSSFRFQKLPAAREEIQTNDVGTGIDWKWNEIPYTGLQPTKREGHTATAVEDLLIIFSKSESFVQLSHKYLLLLVFPS